VQAEIELQVDVSAPVPTAWSWVSQWPRQQQWIPFTRVRHVDGPVLGIGTRVVARTAVGPLGFDDPMTVTAVGDSPDGSRSYEMVHTGRLVHGVGAITVHAVDGGARSRVVWWERVEVPGGPAAPLLWRLGGPVTRLTFGWALRRLARRAEADRSVPG
jgi:Polyketide cyclase / dehydrase and lipid transport